MKKRSLVLAAVAVLSVIFSAQAFAGAIKVKPVAIHPTAIQKVSTSRLLMKILSDELLKYCKAKGSVHCASMSDASFFSMLVRSPVFTSDLGVKAFETGAAADIKAQVALLKKAASGGAKAFELNEAHKVVDKVYVKDLGLAADTLLYGEYIYAKALGIPMEALAKVQGTLSAQKIEEWLLAAQNSADAQDSHSGGGGAGGGNFTMPSVASALNSVAACIMAAKSGGKGFGSGLPGGGVSDPSPVGTPGDPSGPGGGWNGGLDDKPNANGKGVQQTSSGGFTSSFMGDCFGLDPAKTGGLAGKEKPTNGYSDLKPGHEEHFYIRQWATDGNDKIIGVVETHIKITITEVVKHDGANTKYKADVTETRVFHPNDAGKSKLIGRSTSEDEDLTAKEIQNIDNNARDHVTPDPNSSGSSDEFDPESDNSSCCSHSAAIANCILGSVGNLGGCYDGSDSGNWAKTQGAPGSGDFGGGICGGGGGGGNPAQYFDYAGWDVTDPSPMSVEILKDTISEYGAGSPEVKTFVADMLN